jgi:hypothetical protein
MPAAENFAFRELPSLAEQSNPIFCSSLPSLNVDLFASDAPASNAGAGVPAAAPRAAAVLPAPDGAAVGGVAAAGDASVALADQFKGGIIGVAIATALLAAATAIVAVVQFIIDGFSKIDFSDGTAKYAISPDKPNFAVDEHGNTVLGDEITFSVTELNSGTVLDGSKITWSVLSSSDKPENYVTLIGNKLRIDHLPKDSFDITIQAIIKDENGDKTLVVEFKIPLPNK